MVFNKTISKIESLCASDFWNTTLSWYSEYNADLTYCFEETFLLWTPCFILFLFTILEVINLNFMKKYPETGTSTSTRNINYQIESSPKLHPIPWNLFIISNLLICLALIIINIVEILNVLWYHNYLIPIKPIDWLSPFIKIITLIYLIYVQLLFRRYNIYSSGPVFIFSMLFALYHLINFRTIFLSISSDGIYNMEINNTQYVCRTLATLLSIFHLLFNCFSHPQTKRSSYLENYYGPLYKKFSNSSKYELSNQQINPWFTSGFLSRITFWWFNKIIWLGYKRPLVEQDMFNLDQSNRCDEILQNFQKKLDQYIKKNTTKKSTINCDGYEILEDKRESKISLGWVLMLVHWKLILFTAVMKFISSMMTFINPIILDYLITFMSSKNEPYWHGFFYASLMLISPALESIINNQYEYWVNIIVLRVRISITSLIYNKSLRMSNYSRSQYSSGEIANIMSVDSQNITDFLVNANLIWSSPLQIVIAFYFLWQQVQVASMAGLSFMIILIPLNGYIMRKINFHQKQVMYQKDKRTKMMNEVLNGMKVLKLYAWENSFFNIITRLRDLECHQLYAVALYNGFISFAFMSAPFLIGLLTFTTYVMMGNVLDPNKAFVSLSLFSIIRIPFGMLPMLLTKGVQYLVSMERINKYLNCEELDEDAIEKLPDNECSIRIKDATFTWQLDGPATLKNINLEVRHGKLIAVVGTVGSGKSSLLSSIIGDMDKLTGSINVDGSLAYVPQQAWMQNQSVLRNIIFSSLYKEQKYKKIVKCCCLDPDIQIWAAGNHTEIGERGINLSGGQKQRIALARAVYADADIYLLDDPLSAVDSNVGNKLFKKVIGNEGLLKNKTRILATHRAMILPEVDEIIVMKDGEISERGTLNELINSQRAFAEFIAEYMDQNFDTKHEELSRSSVSDFKTFVEKVRPLLERSKSRSNIHLRDPLLYANLTTRKKKNQTKEADSEISSSSSDFSFRVYKKSSPSISMLSLGKSHKFFHPSSPPFSSLESIGRLIKGELAQSGSVKLSVYKQYLQKIGTGITIFILISMIIANGFAMATYIWLSNWTDDALDPVKATDTSLRDFRLIIYGSLGVGEILFSISSITILNLVCIRAAKSLHNDMLTRIMFAPMSFFDTTPVGRILNRFTKDVDVTDNLLAFNLRMALLQFFRTIISFILLILEAPVILFGIIPIIIFYFFIQRIYIASSRQLKRIELITRSPIYHHFNETINGSSTIKAFGVQKEFILEYNRLMDANNSCFYSSQVANRWLSIRLEFFGYLIVFLAALFAIIYRDSLSPGLAGLAINSSLNITIVMGMFVKSLTEMETNIVSVERLIEYCQVQQEKYFQSHWKVSKRWPKKGAIKFECYSTRYRPGLDLVLRGINLDIIPCEKVGVVGRTGSGKSSLTLALFRIIEPYTGIIMIDNVNITHISLFELRSRITIIPQEPVLFTGNLRMNLDPSNHHDDEKIWQALKMAHLKDFVQSLEGQLQYSINEGGENISVGQRQLVCLARALLKKSKILILDEATSAIDMETDELIQKTIRREFNDCTIITIAHRLNTVIDYDRILVLDHGKIVEFDSPRSLLERTDSILYSMAKKAKLI